MNKSYLALCQLCAGEVNEPWKFLPSLVKNLKREGVSKTGVFHLRDIREKWVCCTNSFCVLCPISGIRYKETLIAAEEGITRCSYGNGLLPWSGGSWRRQAPCSSLFPLSILSIPFWQQKQQLTAPGTSLCFCVLLTLSSCSCHPLLPLGLVLIHRLLQRSSDSFMEEPEASCAGHIQAKETAFPYQWMLSNPHYMEDGPAESLLSVPLAAQELF